MAITLDKGATRLWYLQARSPQEALAMETVSLGSGNPCAILISGMGLSMEKGLLAMSTQHFGEIEDGKVYTHLRLAQIFNTRPQWILDNYLLPVDGEGNPIEGVSCRKVGHVYQISGEALRLWHEEHARPLPPREKANRNQKRNSKKSTKG